MIKETQPMTCLIILKSSSSTLLLEVACLDLILVLEYMETILIDSQLMRIIIVVNVSIKQLIKK